MRGWWRALRGCVASRPMLPSMGGTTVRRVGAEASEASTLQTAVEETAAKVGAERKLLRVGVLGVPNAGKSTLINHFVGGKVREEKTGIVAEESSLPSAAGGC